MRPRVYVGRRGGDTDERPSGWCPTPCPATQGTPRCSPSSPGNGDDRARPGQQPGGPSGEPSPGRRAHRLGLLDRDRDAHSDAHAGADRRAYVDAHRGADPGGHRPAHDRPDPRRHVPRGAVRDDAHPRAGRTRSPRREAAERSRVRPIGAARRPRCRDQGHGLRRAQEPSVRRAVPDRLRRSGGRIRVRRPRRDPDDRGLRGRRRLRQPALRRGRGRPRAVHPAADHLTSGSARIREQHQRPSLGFTPMG